MKENKGGSSQGPSNFRYYDGQYAAQVLYQQNSGQQFGNYYSQNQPQHYNQEQYEAYYQQMTGSNWSNMYVQPGFGTQTTTLNPPFSAPSIPPISVRPQLKKRKTDFSNQPQKLYGQTPILSQPVELPIQQRTMTPGEIISAPTQYHPIRKVHQPPRPTQGKYHCEVCNCYCNDNNAYGLHLAGKKHAANMKRKGLPLDLNIAPNLQTFPHSTSTPPQTHQTSPDDQIVSVKHNDLCPTSSHAVALASLVGKVVEALEALEGISEVKLIGSYAKGTMLKDHLIADVVAILNDMPTLAKVKTICDNLKKSFPQGAFGISSEGAQIKVVEKSNGATVRTMTTWLKAWDYGKEPNTQGEGQTQGPTAAPTDLDISECQLALGAVRHAMWFSEMNIPQIVRSTIRVLKYYRLKTSYWTPLNPWALDVLVERSITRAGGTGLGLAKAIRSVFEFVSGGALLPGGVGLPDPCITPADPSTLKDETEKEIERMRIDISSDLKDEERDEITKNAQETLRAIAFGKWEAVLG